MKLLFIDSGHCAYDTRSHLTQPLGGTQSAIACLSKALARLGHEVSVINGVETARETDGVQFMALPCPTPLLNSFDVVIPVSGAIGKVLRGIGCIKPLVLWTHHAANQPAIQALTDPDERSLFSGFAMVSQWQADTYVRTFGLPVNAVKVLRNAVSRAFLEVEPHNDWLTTGSPPILGYTSAPYRGLDILLLSFASIRRRIEGATLHVFSSMGIYGPDVPDDYSAFYDLAHALPGVTYVGPLPQPRLAEAMTAVDIWAYPSTFAETSCISAMEAMAAGNVITSTSLGALPETTREFGHLTDFDPAQTSGMQASQFASHVVSTAQSIESDKAGAKSKLEHQLDFVRNNYTWEQRADEWIEWLKGIV